MLKIIDNKRIDLTDDEWLLFNRICDSYKEFGGEVLFSDLFETDERGLITYIKPPSKKQCTLEIFLYVVSVFNHQHIREMYKQIDDIDSKLTKKFDELAELVKSKKDG